MLIETPLQYLQRFVPAAYLDKVYSGVVLNTGSDTVLQDDFLDNVWTPDNTLVKNSNKTFDSNDTTVVTFTSGAWPALVTGQDVLMVSVFKVADISALVSHAMGSLTAGMHNKSNSLQFPGGNGADGGDGTTALPAVSLSIVEEDNAVNGDTILMASAWDRNVGLEQYIYNITQGKVIVTNTSTGVANEASFVPAGTTRFTNMDSVYAALTFSFPSNGLPASATWKADMLTLANSAIALKDA